MRCAQCGCACCFSLPSTGLSRLSQRRWTSSALVCRRNTRSRVLLCLSSTCMYRLSKVRIAFVFAFFYFVLFCFVLFCLVLFCFVLVWFWQCIPVREFPFGLEQDTDAPEGKRAYQCFMGKSKERMEAGSWDQQQQQQQQQQ